MRTYNTKWRPASCLFSLGKSAQDQAQKNKGISHGSDAIEELMRPNCIRLVLPGLPHLVQKGGLPKTTERLALDTPVKDIGNVFCRLMNFIKSFSTDKIFILTKVDLPDGLFIILVEEDGKWYFAYVMPDPTGIPVLLVLPSLLQMVGAEIPE